MFLIFPWRQWLVVLSILLLLNTYRICAHVYIRFCAMQISRWKFSAPSSNRTGLNLPHVFILLNARLHFSPMHIFACAVRASSALNPYLYHSHILMQHMNIFIPGKKCLTRQKLISERKKMEAFFSIKNNHLQKKTPQSMNEIFFSIYFIFVRQRRRNYVKTKKN